MGTRFSCGLGCGGRMVGLDLEGVSKPKQFSDSEPTPELGMRDGKVMASLYQSVLKLFIFTMA